MEIVTYTQYKSFDGKLFNTREGCEEYERRACAKKIGDLKQFYIAFPMQDQVTDCTAYLITSEDDFNAFKKYIDDDFTEVFAEDIPYDGNGWYVLQDDHCGYAHVEKLSAIIHDWNKTMERITQYTMDFKEE